MEEDMRAVIQCNPWSLLRNLQEDVTHLFDQKLVKRGESDQSTAAQWLPQVDIKETANQFIIAADLPGVVPNEIEVSMEQNVLTIKGERKLDHQMEGENYSRQERFVGTFYRRFTLPEQIDSDQIEARSKQGVLEIILPKKQQSMAKKIEIKALEE
jgi:HSP20 family protein